MEAVIVDSFLKMNPERKVRTLVRKLSKDKKYTLNAFRRKNALQLSQQIASKLNLHGIWRI